MCSKVLMFLLFVTEALFAQSNSNFSVDSIISTAIDLGKNEIVNVLKKGSSDTSLYYIVDPLFQNTTSKIPSANINVINIKKSSYDTWRQNTAAQRVIIYIERIEPLKDGLIFYITSGVLHFKHNRKTIQGITMSKILVEYDCANKKWIYNSE